tara:strand:+ start:623 stop:1078 length:456 start_codon:yes stop_codon:yes gene_type:complete
MIKPPNYLIVHTSWYQEEIAKMIEIAEKQLGVSKNVNEGTWKLRVPGALELAAGAKRYLKRHPDVNGIIFCGIVIRGETSHYDLVTQETFRSIGNLALEFPNIYMVNNVICVENKEQLIERLEKNTVNNSNALKEMIFNDLDADKDRGILV